MSFSRVFLAYELMRAWPFAQGRALVAPRWGWGIAMVAIALWSLLCGGAWLLVTLTGNWLITGASLGAAWNVGLVEWVTQALSFVQEAGHLLLALLWAAVTLGITVVAWVLTSLRLGAPR